MINIKQLFLYVVLCSTVSCNSQEKVYKSPAGYNLAGPEKFNMPAILQEISGIAFNKANSDTIYAEQDEEGKLFHFKPGNDNMIVTKFGKRGDYEDVTICNNYVVMLRSDGVLFSFPLSEANNEKAATVKEWNSLLPAGEFEGLASNDSTGQLYVLCKHCSDDKTSKTTGGFILQLSADGNIAAAGNFEINVADIAATARTGKISFHPSALAQNPVTKEWYILSSVNKLLVITGADWKVKETYALNPALFPQPEGIAFDDQRSLYISNERNTTAYGTILKFTFHKE